MDRLHVENRDMSIKAKQLRRKGIVPGTLYGKNLANSLSIQVSQREAAQFLKSNSAGSRVELAMGEKKILALLREVTYLPLSDDLEHLSFQTLLAGEMITTTAKIVLLNREMVSGIVQQPQTELSYRALTSDLIEKVEIDLADLQVGDSIRIADLEIAQNPKIEILNPPDSMVVAVADIRRASGEPGEQAEVEDEKEKE